MPEDLQSLCELGQRQLSSMDYLNAERTLVDAENLAMTKNDLDTLGRLYMPLQEARRQIRQRCGEGVVKLDLLARDGAVRLDPEAILNKYPHGQLLIAGWGTLEPSIRFRELVRRSMSYVETFLAAVYPVGDSRAIVIVGLADVAVPDAAPRSIDELIRKLPPQSIVLAESELPSGETSGTWKTFAHTMSLWERLHSPYLAAADMQRDGMAKIDAYRRTIRVDPACELAHQKLSWVARELARTRISGSAS